MWAQEPPTVQDVSCISLPSVATQGRSALSGGVPGASHPQPGNTHEGMIEKAKCRVGRLNLLEPSTRIPGSLQVVS
jgi:hypothetical protein